MSGNKKYKGSMKYSDGGRFYLMKRKVGGRPHSQMIISRDLTEVLVDKGFKNKMPITITYDNKTDSMIIKIDDKNGRNNRT